MTSQGLTAELAAFVGRARAEDVDSEVMSLAGDGFVDGIAVMLAGQIEEATRIVHAYVQETQAGGPVTVVGSRLKTNPAAAALINGTSAHAHDFDDTQLSATPDRIYGLMSHPTAPVLAATLVAAEVADASGIETLMAYLLGVEVTCRVCDTIDPHHYLRGFHSTATTGVFGATAAASRLLSLDPQQTEYAFGLAASMSAGLRGNFGTMAKPLHAGRAAESGIVAAMLAAKGFDSQRNALEASDGFFKTFGAATSSSDPAIVADPLWGYRKAASSGFDPERGLRDLGHEWAFRKPGVSIKPYPSVVLSHPSMSTLLDIVTEGNIRPDDIAKINVYAGPTVLKLKYGIPKSGTEGKFSLIYCMALIATKRSALLHDFTDDVVRQPAVTAMMDRVSLLEDPEIASLGYSVIASRIEVIMKDGSVRTRKSGPYKGGPENRLTEAELEAKFMHCAGSVLPADQSAGVLVTLRRLAELPSIRGLTGKLMPA